MLGAGWMVLAEGDPAAIPAGVPIVAAALAASLLVAPAPGPRWSAPGLLRFAVTFVTGSLRGGVDVARRALSPNLALAPALVRHRLALPAGPARNLFLGTVSLMPGTLAAEVEDGHAIVHVLAESAAIAGELEALERSIARALGVPMEPAGG